MFLFKTSAQQLNFCYVKFNSCNHKYSTENEEIPIQENSLPSKARGHETSKNFCVLFYSKKETLEVFILEVSYDCIHQLY